MWVSLSHTRLALSLQIATRDLSVYRNLAAMCWSLRLMFCVLATTGVSGVVYLDKRLITSATLMFPRYGGTRQGVAGCPVRRVLHPKTGELHCPLSTAACVDGTQWIVQVRGEVGEHQAECRSAPCAVNNTVLWSGQYLVLLLNYIISPNLLSFYITYYKISISIKTNV